MTFKQFTEMALSNDIICIVDDIVSGTVQKQKAAFRYLTDNDKELNMLVDRFTPVKNPKTNHIYIFVSLKAV